MTVAGTELSLPQGTVIIRDGDPLYPPLRVVRGIAWRTREGQRLSAFGPGDSISLNGARGQAVPISVVAATAMRVVPLGRSAATSDAAEPPAR